MIAKKRPRLIELAEQNRIYLKSQDDIASEAIKIVTAKHNYSTDEVKKHFDELIFESENEAYKVYLRYELEYGEEVIKLFTHQSIKEGKISSINDVSGVFGKQFKLLDAFFLSIAQSRKARAGKTFEVILRHLFKTLDYPFEEKVIINGAPDFLMPSAKYYMKNPMDSIIFTSKRTLRERWRQIVTEGTRGLGFFLATMDSNVSENQLGEMLANRIYLVIPQKIIDECYTDTKNVLSFRDFFEDHLDPAVKRWRRKGVI